MGVNVWASDALFISVWFRIVWSQAVYKSLRKLITIVCLSVHLVTE